MLESIGACRDGIKAFKREFPSGRATWQQVVAMVDMSEEYAKYVAWLGQVCPAGVEGATWEARVALQRDESDRAYLGRRCPAGVKGATWAARLAVQRDDCERAWLGRHCPSGVDGATLEARMAVQA